MKARLGKPGSAVRSGPIVTGPAVLLLAAMLIGTGVRLWMIVRYQRESFAADELFDRLGWNLARGLGFTLDGETPSAHVGPLYPAILAGWYAVVGHRPEWVPYLHVLFDLGTAGLLFCAGRSLFGPGVAATTAAVFYLYPAYWTYDLRIRTESVLTLLATAWLWAAISCARFGNGWMYARSGVVGGVAILCKPILFAVALLLAAQPVISRGAGRGLFTRVAWYVGCLALVVLPWTVRNLHTFGSFIPVSAGVGAGLWMGTDPVSGGSWPMPFPEEAHIWETAGITPLRYPYVMYEVPLDRELKQKALARIAADPVGYLRLTAARVSDLWIGNRFYLFNGVTTLRDGFLSDAAERGPLIAAYSLAKRLLLVPGALLLAVWAGWRHRAAWRVLYPVYALPAGLTLGYIPFCVEAGRYVLPILPCVFLVSVVAIMHLSPRLWPGLARSGVEVERTKVHA
ncbi:MAG: glycosyltransferase family 39 protein [Nitrospiraceae bacterium]